jgi:hypothetical protein
VGQRVKKRLEPYLVVLKDGHDSGPGRVVGCVPAATPAAAVAVFLEELPVELPEGIRLEGIAARIVPGEPAQTRSWREKKPGVWLYSLDEVQAKIKSYPPDARRTWRNK